MGIICSSIYSTHEIDNERNRTRTRVVTNARNALIDHDREHKLIEQFERLAIRKINRLISTEQ